ncbi:hypothetical protein CEE69_31305 [Rhodopirellula bahusiensis]|uniref:Uncharacterized protein n=2 Tax=Rhodopirellula bahusiensis TaxID=2014065 RepID=A0A2G1VXA1_9BACT|nr:hypothetical protein CEE69_31305 [Rhodopirellula bahusiensis]
MPDVTRLIFRSIMNDASTQLQNHFGVERDRIQDLLAYFQRVDDGDFAGDEQTEVNLLPPSECIALTEDLDCHPLFDCPEGANFLVLDDANTSDHHCYALDFPYPGCVIFVPHGDKVRVVFRNLVEYVKACETAIETDTSLRDYHRTDVLLHPDQSRLNQTLSSLLTDGEEELLYLLVGASDLADATLVNGFLASDDFCLRAAVADRIAAGPHFKLLDYAKRCATDRHANVWRPGKRALGAIEAILPEKRG